MIRRWQNIRVMKVTSLKNKIRPRVMCKKIRCRNNSAERIVEFWPDLIQIFYMAVRWTDCVIFEWVNYGGRRHHIDAWALKYHLFSFVTLTCFVNIHYVASNSLLLYNRRFFARDSIYAKRAYAIAIPSVRLSVCPSVTRVDQSKTVEVRIMQFSPRSSPIPLVFVR